MKKKSYSFKLKKQVNNLKGYKLVSNQIKDLKHTMSNLSYTNLCKKFYASNKQLLIELAEENINTICDLDNYLSWLEQYGEFWC